MRCHELLACQLLLLCVDLIAGEAEPCRPDNCTFWTPTPGPPHTECAIDNHSCLGLTATLPPKRRISSLSVSNQFSFSHISKTGGSSVITQVGSVLPRWTPHRPAGEEFSARFSMQKNPGSYACTALRSPRKHVASLFAECAYDKWGQQVTTKDFPRHGVANMAMDFELWLDAFLEPKDPADPSASLPRDDVPHMGCYHPSNFQARYMTVMDKNPHYPKGTPFEPSVPAAVATYWEHDWVAITDFYHESICLLYSRLQSGKRSPIPAAAKTYLQSCSCGASEKPSKDAHVTHHKEGHWESTYGLSAQVLGKVDRLSRSDLALYRVALLSFLREIKALETTLGHRVLCDHTLREQEAELAYVVPNITLLYYEIGQPEHT